MTAQELAREIMRTMGTDGEPRRVLDTAYGDPGWLAYEETDDAIIVYDDEPDTQVATGNHHGRFQPLAG